MSSPRHNDTYHPGIGDSVFTIRNERAGDIDVIKEVYVDDVYDLRGMQLEGIQPRLIIDVGAHIGSFSMLAHELFPQARILAIEPNPRSFQLLRSNVGHFARTWQCGIGRSTEQLLLTDARESTGSGFTVREDELDVQCQKKHAIDGYHYAPAAKVFVHTIDHILRISGVSSSETIDILKLDCEGAEFDLFCSISPALAGQVKCIVGEYHDLIGFNHFRALATRAFPHLEFETRREEGSIGIFWTKREVREEVLP